MQNVVVAHAKIMICEKFAFEHLTVWMSCRHCYKLEDCRKSNLL